jgi:hypothetical protein
LKALRIIVSGLLLLAAWPFFYLGFIGIWAVVHGPIEPIIALGFLRFPFASALVTLNTVGTIVSLRHVPLFVLAVAAFYLGWAFSVYQFPGLWPFSLSWTVILILALTSLNVAWIVSSLRRLGFDSREQLRIFVQALVFLAAFYVALLGWSHPFGPDNLPAASIFWVDALVIAGLNLAWTIRSYQRRRHVAAINSQRAAAG